MVPPATGTRDPPGSNIQTSTQRPDHTDNKAVFPNRTRPLFLGAHIEYNLLILELEFNSNIEFEYNRASFGPEAACAFVLRAPCFLFQSPCSVLCAPCFVLRIPCFLLRALCSVLCGLLERITKRNGDGGWPVPSPKAFSIRPPRGAVIGLLTLGY